MHEERTEALRNEALALYQQGQLQAVIVKILGAGDLADDDFDLQTMLGACYARLGQGEPAINAFRSALRLRPNSPQAFYNLGAQLAAVGRTSEAIPMLDQVLLQDPNHTGARNLLTQLQGQAAAAGAPAAPTAAAHPQNSSPDLLPDQPGLKPKEEERRPAAAPPVGAISGRPSRYDASAYEVEEKKSPLGAIITAILLLALVGGGIYGYLWWQRENSPETAINRLQAAIEKGDTAEIEKYYIFSIPPTLQPAFAMQGIDENGFKTATLENLSQQAKAGRVGKSEPLSTKFNDDGTADVRVRVTTPLPSGQNDTRELTYRMVKKDGRWAVDFAQTFENNKEQLMEAMRRQMRGR